MAWPTATQTTAGRDSSCLVIGRYFCAEPAQRGSSGVYWIQIPHISSRSSPTDMHCGEAGSGRRTHRYALETNRTRKPLENVLGITDIGRCTGGVHDHCAAISASSWVAIRVIIGRFTPVVCRHRKPPPVRNSFRPAGFFHICWPLAFRSGGLPTYALSAGFRIVFSARE